MANLFLILSSHLPKWTYYEYGERCC